MERGSQGRIQGNLGKDSKAARQVPMVPVVFFWRELPNLPDKVIFSKGHWRFWQRSMRPCRCY